MDQRQAVAEPQRPAKKVGARSGPLGGILSGWFTPTEAGVVAALWIILVIIPALNPRHIWNLPYDFCLAGLIFSLPLITIGAANAFGYLLAYLRGAIVISEWIIAIAGSDP